MTEDRKIELFNSNIGLVYCIARRHWGRYCVEEEDLVQEGMLALWNLIDSYDDTRSSSFSSYASPIISNRLYDYVQKYRFGNMSKSSYFQDAMAAVKYSKVNNVSLEEAYEKYNLTGARQEYAQIIADRESLFISLSTPVTSDGDDVSYYEDTINVATDSFEYSVCEHLDSMRLMKDLYTNFVEYCIESHRGEVPTYYTQLIHLFLDSIFYKTQTQNEIGKHLGISYTLVSKYFRKLRALLKKYVLQNHLVSAGGDM